MPGSPLGYGYHWWALPHLPTGIHAGAFLAGGSFGQYIYVHPTTQVIAVIQSAWHQHQDIGAHPRSSRCSELMQRSDRTRRHKPPGRRLPRWPAQSVPERPCWVIRTGLTGPRRLSGYPPQRTSSAPIGRSVSCQQRPLPRDLGNYSFSRKANDFDIDATSPKCGDAMSSRLDHLLICVRDLAQAALTGKRSVSASPRPVCIRSEPATAYDVREQFYRAAGRHRCAAVPPAASSRFSFAAHNQDFLATAEGMSMLAMHSDDAHADAARFKANHIDAYAPFDFGRDACPRAEARRA